MCGFKSHLSHSYDEIVVEYVDTRLNSGEDTSARRCKASHVRCKSSPIPPYYFLKGVLLWLGKTVNDILSMYHIARYDEANLSLVKEIVAIRFLIINGRYGNSQNIAVSPRGKARDFDSRIRWFKSNHQYCAGGRSVSPRGS